MEMDSVHKLLNNVFIEGGMINQINFSSSANMGMFCKLKADVTYDLENYTKFCKILGIRDFAFLCSNEFPKSKLAERMGSTYYTMDMVGIESVDTKYEMTSDGGTVRLSVVFCNPDFPGLLEVIQNTSNTIQWLAMNAIIDTEILGEDIHPTPPAQMKIVEEVKEEAEYAPKKKRKY